MPVGILCGGVAVCACRNKGRWCASVGTLCGGAGVCL